jgi:hypothetical protein
MCNLHRNKKRGDCGRHNNNKELGDHLSKTEAKLDLLLKAVETENFTILVSIQLFGTVPF